MQDTDIRLDSLIARVREHGTPIIDGNTATFVWEGEQPPDLIGDFNNFGWREPRPRPQKIAPDIWTYTLELPRDAYVEYLFRRGDETCPDPANPNTVDNGIGGTHSFFFMPEAQDTPLTYALPNVPHGEITEHEIKSEFRLVGGRRTVYLYHPPTDEPCPLLVVYDGEQYLLHGSLNHIVDNLIAQKRIRPVAMALVNHGEQARAIEYNSSDSTVGMVVDDLLPLARKHLKLLSTWHVPGAYGVLGASMGGLMALYTGLRRPDLFGHVISQSGAFGPVTEQRVVNDIVRYFPPRPLKIWLDVGRYEALLPSNRGMRDLLHARGYDLTYREVSSGHNYTAWRNNVWRGLEALYGTEA